jgi:hypothetical protein
MTEEEVKRIKYLASDGVLINPSDVLRLITELFDAWSIIATYQKSEELRKEHGDEPVQEVSI